MVQTLRSSVGHSLSALFAIATKIYCVLGNKLSLSETVTSSHTTQLLSGCMYPKEAQ